VSDRVRIAPPTADDASYAVFVTDFSSYRFDFVYLRRAIAYFFPDEELFRSGMCDYRETDLPLGGTFGDMATDAEGLVEILGGILERGGAPKPEYAAQMEGFFLHYDHGCRERIYQALAGAPEEE
jgi:CDP-glycerol glycerophosphotransferase (TagB/SpsB family)